tara:strand:+ start:1351 stop:1530 length:180 start_codon:yes stop_codon:yes gene_type:complete
MEELLKKQLHWKTQLGITDSTDPYSNHCRAELTHVEALIEAEKSKSKSKSKKSTKKSKK